MEVLSWFLVEALAAAALLALVVWWTWPRPPKDEHNEQSGEAPRDDSRQ
jgi:hypothetical protein